MTPPPGKKIQAIQGVRGLAAGVVMVYHLLWSVAPDFGVSAPEWVVHYGLAGVDLFFLISGYLIFRILRDSDDHQGFVLRRLIRVVPALWVCSAVVYAINLRFGSPFPWTTVVASALMLPGVFDLTPLLPHAWSLSYELAFYLGAAAVAAGWRRHRALGLGLGLLGCALLVPPNPRFAYLLVGAAVGLRAVPVRGGLLWMGLFGLVTSQLFQGAQMWDSIWVVDPLGYGLSLPLGYLTMCAVLTPDTTSARVWSTAPLKALGLISYSFYLWHNLLLYLLHQRWSWTAGWPAFAAFVAVASAAVVLLSWLSYRVIEEDVGHWLRRRLGVERP